MKLISYIAAGESRRHRRLGVVLDDGIIANLRAGYARLLNDAGDLQGEAVAAARIGTDVAALLAGGPVAMAEARKAAHWLERLHRDQADARGLDDEPLFLPFSAGPPVRAGGPLQGHCRRSQLRRPLRRK